MKLLLFIAGVYILIFRVSSRPAHQEHVITKSPSAPQTVLNPQTAIVQNIDTADLTIPLILTPASLRGMASRVQFSFAGN